LKDKNENENEICWLVVVNSPAAHFVNIYLKLGSKEGNSDARMDGHGIIKTIHGRKTHHD